ncbi:hypothetical protein [Pseudomonas aeruginosa]|uniref:hypothetical protein n=1 Tax=Pseudomonas aeruginosa TaxID=287 RepID=UPI0022308B20|nr:hypothetical protein [Pseudomonas aeruginosa]
MGGGLGGGGGGVPGSLGRRFRGGALGGVSLASQALGSLLGVTVAFAGGLLVYGLMKALLGIRLSQEEEYYGADLSIHKIGAISHE